jgi:2-octaprenyl-6-methoxyphenol hydroxylase
LRAGAWSGSTLALALAGGLKVLIADPMSPAQLLDERFDGRVSALAFASVRMMGILGVWDSLLSDAQPINDIVVSDGELVASRRRSRCISIIARSARSSATSSKTAT